MLRVGRIFLLCLALFLGGAFLSAWNAYRLRERLPRILTSQIEKQGNFRLSFREMKLAFVPLPVLRATGLRLESSERSFSPWTAEEGRISIRLLPLLVGRVQFSGIHVRGGAGRLWQIPLERMELKMKNVAPGRTASFEVRGRDVKGEEVLNAKGKWVPGKRAEEIWKESGLKGQVRFSSFSFSEGMDPSFVSHLPPVLRESQWKGTFSFTKDKDAEMVGGSVQFQAENLFAPPDRRFSLALAAALSWNVRTSLFEFKQLSLESPFGEVGGSGVWNFETGEIKETRFIGRRIVLEDVLRSFPDFNRVLPLDTGLSGETEFDLTLKGSWDYLSLHANWNLTPAVLTLGKVFSKSRDFPMVVNFDLLLKEKNLLSGDLSTRMGGTTLKAALVALDLTTGSGEITLLTNKFELKNWVPLLPVFAPYTVSGEAKLLVNLKGDLIHFTKAEKTFNVTLDRVSLLGPSGRGLGEATGQADVSPLNLRIKDAVLKWGDSALQVRAEIYNFYESPQGTFQILSPRLQGSEVLENAEPFQAEKLLEKVLPSWPRVKKELGRFLPLETPLEEFSLKGELGPEKVAVKALEFRAFAGGVRLAAAQDRSGESPRFSLQVQLDQVNLARYFEARGLGGRGPEGNLFFDGQFEAQAWTGGEFSKALQGEGRLSLTNGEWHSFDPASPLKGLKEFEAVQSRVSEAASFHDLKAEWRFREGRFETEELLFHSGDYWVEGKGNLSLTGSLNTRLDVYLSERLTQEVLDSWKTAEEAGGRQLGPIPLLLVGELTRPELRVDERSLASFLEWVRSRRYRRILRRPFQD